MANSSKTRVVVGGGIVGLVSALAASEMGPVSIYDPGIGSGATYAAAGMLSPGAELLAGEHHALNDAEIALREWPDFLNSLGSPEQLFFPAAGSLLTGYSRGDHEEIRRLTALAGASSLPCQIVTRPADAARFEDISPRFDKGVFFGEDAFVDVDALVATLIDVLKSRGVTILNKTVRRIEGGETAVVYTDDGSCRYDAGLVCTGALTDLIGQGHASSVRSVRGVTIRLRRLTPVAPRMVRGLIDGRSVYIVDRPNGEVIIGASADESAERYVDTLAVAELLRLALLLSPSLDTAEFLEARSGLRPVGPNGQPFLERVSTSWGWHSGYYRHGVLMAPLAYRRAVEFWND